MVVQENVCGSVYKVLSFHGRVKTYFSVDSSYLDELPSGKLHTNLSEAELRSKSLSKEEAQDTARTIAKHFDTLNPSGGELSLEDLEQVAARDGDASNISEADLNSPPPSVFEQNIDNLPGSELAGI